MPAIQLHQNAFRFRNDDGTETAATWKAAVDTKIPLLLDTPFRLRFLIARDSQAPNENGLLGLFVSHNGVAFVSAGDNAVVVGVDSPHFVRGDDTTQQLGSDTYISNNNSMGEDNGSFLNGTSFTWTGGLGTTEVECEFAMKVPSNLVRNGDTIELRARHQGNELVSHPSTPTLTVVKGGLRISGGTFRVSGG